MSARAGHLFVAGVSGLSVMVVEFAAVRMVAPAFGQSITIWSTVIGVILVALALGYWIGGRLGERSRNSQPLLRLYVWCAIYLWLVTQLGPRLCTSLIPEDVGAARWLPLGFQGSLIASVVLFAFPTFILAMTSPFLIRLEARAGREGRAAGAVYAVGTLGSLIGCYLAPLVLLQTLGTAATLLANALVLLALGLGGTAILRWRAGKGQPLAAARIPAGTVTEAIGRRYRWVAAWTGLAVTGIEFAGVRYMAPWFGQSNYIWANVIGVMLLALAAGSWVGGRWADAALARGPLGGRVLYHLLVVSGVWIGAVTLAGPGLCEALVPESVESMHILPIAFRGSLVATVAFFAVPLMLLGMAAPFLVRMATVGDHAGRTAGVLFAWTTVGGLAGCFLTAPLLVPQLGARGTLLLAAASLAALAVLALRPGPWRAAGAQGGRLGLGVATTATLLLSALLGVHLAVRKPLRVQIGQVAEIESAYQTIRVVRRSMPLLAPFEEGDAVPALLGTPGEAETVFLRHDEDAETYQSVVFADPRRTRAWLTGGRYFEHMALGAHFARPPARRLRILIIGYAGGTVYRTIRDVLPQGAQVSVLGVEIDPAVIEVARTHLRHGELEGEDLELITGVDARTVVNALPKARVFDLVLVDAYARTNYLPFQLATVEFFERVRAHLAPGGWIGVNVLGSGLRSPVARAVASTLARVNEVCFITPNPSYLGNVILWSSPWTKDGPRLRAGVQLHPGLQSAAFALERLTVRHDPARDGGIVLTDDKSPSDRLADEEFGL